MADHRYQHPIAAAARGGTAQFETARWSAETPSRRPNKLPNEGIG
jgi:hypothetical protein